MVLAAGISTLLLQRMHGGCFWMYYEIGSRASEAARIMAEWSCIDEREWMERRRKERRKDRRPRRTAKEKEDQRELLEVVDDKSVVQIMVDEYRDAQIDSGEVFSSGLLLKFSVAPTA